VQRQRGHSLRAHSSPNRIRRVAVLESDNGGPNQSHIAAFRQAIDKLGWHEGRNIQFEIRLAENNINRARGYAEELAAMMPDVFLATNVQMAQLLQNKTRSIPIVFIRVPDPVGSGLVANAASPAGNVTGFSNFDFSIGGKWLELLKRGQAESQKNSRYPFGWKSHSNRIFENDRGCGRFVCSTVEFDRCQ
jgi:ABC-type uncharacterized transport system substrate-binding protein